jgi:hypothetical protein
MNTLKIILLLSIVSCSSKYLKEDPKLEDIPEGISEVVTPAQVPENTGDIKAETISCYIEPMPKKILKKNEKLADKMVEEQKIEQLAVSVVPWSVGEKTHYEVFAVGMNAAQVDVEVLSMKIIGGSKVWHFTSQAKTKNFASSLYYFNSKAESFVDEYLNPKEYRAASFEGDHKKSIVERYSLDKKSYYLYKKVDDKIETNKDKEQEYSKNSVDLVSVFFFVRIAALNDEFTLLNNHKTKKLKVIKITNEVVKLNGKEYAVEKLTLEYDKKFHYVSRSTDPKHNKKVIQAIVDLKFASGTINLVE